MLLQELLTEDAEQDLTFHQTALGLTNDLRKWLIAKGDMPVNRLFKLKMIDGDLVWIVPFPSEKLAAKNLYFGLQPKGTLDTEAVVKVDVKAKICYVIRNIDASSVEISLRALASIERYINWATTLHEIIHVMDIRRARWNMPDETLYSGSGYYNNPFELNAYFHEGITGALRSLSTINRYVERFPFQNFDEFWAFCHPFFSNAWIQKLSEQNKKRMLRRLYKLYEKLRGDWTGNLPIIRQYQSKLTQPTVWESFKTWVGW